MLILSSFTTEKLVNIGRLRNVNDYERSSIQQLENIITTPSASIAISIPICRSRPRPFGEKGFK